MEEKRNPSLLGFFKIQGVTPRQTRRAGYLLLDERLDKSSRQPEFLCQASLILKGPPLTPRPSVRTCKPCWPP